MAPKSPSAERGGVWYPRWFWPSLATPATAYLLILFLVPLYVILCVTFGGLNQILLTPQPIWNPLHWNTAVIAFTLSNLSHSDGIYQASFIRTFAYVGLATGMCLLVGYPFAYFVARHAGRAKGFFLVAFFAPFWISYMLRMLAWISLLQDNGYVNRILMDLGIMRAPYSWLSGKSVTLVLGLTYGYVPYMILPLFAALDRIPRSQLEAARDLGASPRRSFFLVVLPQSFQAILAGVIIAGLPMFGDYFTQQLLANTDGTRMLGNFVVDSMSSPLLVSRGAALILLMMVLLILPVVYYLKSTARAALLRV